MAKIYDENGWLNWDYLYPECRFILTVTGPRGVGKTYGILRYIAEHGIRFIYLRRLRSQLDQCAADEASNPFKSINDDTGSQIIPKRKRGNVLFEDWQSCNEDDEPNIIGYGAALSTVATIRGSDYSDVSCIVFDEYIAMSTEKPIKNEAQAFFNFIETVNRNRELKGSPPVKVFMLGNANQLLNPYYLEWHFMRTALRMIRGGQMMWRNEDSSRIMVMLLDSPISRRKQQTALYRNAGGDFIQMAIDNAFRTDETRISARPLSDCKHVVSIGSIGIYQLKSTGEHYVSENVSRDNFFDENEINLVFFRSRYGGLKTLYIYGYILFENYDCEMLFRSYIGL